jgi:hypothetical protein
MSGQLSGSVLRLVSAVCTAAAAVIVGAVVAGNGDHLAFVAALAACAIVTEVFDFEPFPNTRVSMTIALIVAAATLSDLTGVALLATAAALADFAAHPKAPEKALFNFGALALSGAAYVGVMVAFAPDTTVWTATIWPALIGTLAAYAVNSGLVALAISLDGGDHAVGVWQECFTWVLPYYLAMGAAGASVAVAYQLWGTGAILFLVIPFAVAWPILKLHTNHVTKRTAANTPA